MNLNEAILNAYNLAKGAEGFRYVFNAAYKKELEAGMGLNLKKAQSKDLMERIWYTTNLMKGRQIKTTGDWLKVVSRVSEKYLLEHVDAYTPTSLTTINKEKK